MTHYTPMDKLNFLFTGTLALVSLTMQKLALFITVLSNDQLQRFVWWLTILWLVMQLTMNAKKWFYKMKDFFKKGR